MGRKVQSRDKEEERRAEKIKRRTENDGEVTEKTGKTGETENW